MRYLAWSVPTLLFAASAVYWLASGSTANSGDVTKIAGYSIEEGAALYAENCATCHGSNLEGQPNWQQRGADGRLPAPPHDETGHTWHHTDRLLFDYTKLGGAALLARQGVDYDSGMPGFGEILSDQEIHKILAYIRSTWPERIREAQAARTKAEEQQGDN